MPVAVSGSRALVLAGAGAAGNAWQTGLVAGLTEAGVDLMSADLIVGTSAGATAAAQFTGGRAVAELYAAILAPVPGGGGPRAASLSGPDYLQWSDAIIAASADAADFRRRIGAAALARDASDGGDSHRWRGVAASRLGDIGWPAVRRLLIPATDARSGEPVVFDRLSGVELVDAVAASTSPVTPYRIGDRRYLSGGYRRSSNADLAAGSERVVVLDPFSGRSRYPKGWGMDLDTQVAELRASGSRVEVVFPDAGAGEVFDAGALDPATRIPAARGGCAQGLALAERIAELW